MEVKEIEDKNIWEKFISENSPQSLFQSWNWGEVVKRIQNLWRLGIFDNEKLVGIAQVNKVIAKKGNFLHIRHGPIFSSLNKKHLNFLLDYLKTLNTKEKTIFLRISPLIANTPENKFLVKSKAPQVSQILFVPLRKSVQYGHWRCPRRKFSVQSIAVNHASKLW